MIKRNGLFLERIDESLKTLDYPDAEKMYLGFIDLDLFLCR